jgi:hypothetical protein
MFARLAKIFCILLVLSLSSIHGAHIEGDRAAEAQLHKKLWRGVVRAASTVKNVPKLLAERSRNIKVAHGIPVPPEPVPQRAVRHDDGCYVAGPVLIDQIVPESPLRHCEYLVDETSSARSYIAGSLLLSCSTFCTCAHAATMTSTLTIRMSMLFCLQARAMSRSARQAATLLSMVLAGATGA